MEKKKALQESEDGPEWIKELNKLVSSIEEEKNSALNAAEFTEKNMPSSSGEDSDKKSTTSDNTHELGNLKTNSN